MINFDAIPDDVKQFMVDKLCDSAILGITVFSVVIAVMIACVTFLVFSLIKNNAFTSESIFILIINIVMITTDFLCLFNDVQKLNEYKKNPETAIVEYINTAYTNNDYYAELCKRGIDIYQMS